MSTPITTLPIPTKQATKFDVGLDQVDNTSDANKPISALQAASIALKADASLLALYQPTATFRETMEDHLLSTFVPGANIAIDYNDALNTFTFSVSGVTISDGDKGDINVSGTGTVWNVETGAISLAKMANMATGSIIGRTTASTGVPEVLSFAALKTAMTFVKADVGLSNVDNTSDATKNTATATLTNKTLTAPVINSPTGLVKADVGLSNVDNTSDATKNAATATLTNKTLTTPVITSPTGLVKADVGLGSVDNTADTAKPVSTLQATAIALKVDTSAIVNNLTTGGAAVPLSAAQGVAIKVLIDANTASIALKANAAAPSFTGIMTSVGASILTATAMGANVLDVAAGHNTKTISADATFTLSATPATNTLFTLELTNSDTNPHIITWPANFFSLAQQAVVATSTIPASGRMLIQMLYNGSVYLVAGDAALGDIAEVTVASATTTPIFAQASNNVAISGTTTITAFDTIAAGAIRVCRATGAFLLTHNATSLILPGGGNITTVAGDMFAVRSEGSGNARVLWFAPTTVTGTGSAVRAVSPTFTGVPLVPTASPGTNTTQAASTAFVTAAVAAGGGGGGTPVPPWEMIDFDVAVQYIGHNVLSTAGANGFAATGGTLVGQTGLWNSTNYGQRVRIPTASASANLNASVTNSQPCGYVPGTVTTDAPIRLSGVFAAGDATTGCRIGAGFKIGSPSTTVEPSAFTDCAQISADSSDSNLRFISNDATSTGANVDLGSNFPKDGGPYAWSLKMVGGGSGVRGVSYWVKNLSTGNVASGSTTTAAELPTAASAVHPWTYRNSAANTSVINLDFGGMWGGFKSGVA